MVCHVDGRWLPEVVWHYIVPTLPIVRGILETRGAKVGIQGRSGTCGVLERCIGSLACFLVASKGLGNVVRGMFHDMSNATHSVLQLAKLSFRSWKIVVEWLQERHELRWRDVPLSLIHI